MSAVPGGEVAATLQRLTNEIDIIKSSHSQQNIDLAQTNAELNMLRLNIPEAGKQAVDSVNKQTAIEIAVLKSDVGSFSNTSQIQIDAALLQLSNAVQHHEAGIEGIKNISGAEFVKQANTISTHEQQLRLHHDTLTNLKANIDIADAEIKKLQKTLHGMAPQGNVDFTVFSGLARAARWEL